MLKKICILLFGYILYRCNIQITKGFFQFSLPILSHGKSIVDILIFGLSKIGKNVRRPKIALAKETRMSDKMRTIHKIETAEITSLRNIAGSS